MATRFEVELAFGGGEEIHKKSYVARARVMAAMVEGRQISALANADVVLTVKSPEGIQSVFRYVNGIRVRGDYEV